MLKRLARNEGAKVQLLQILFDMWRDHPQMLVVLGYLRGAVIGLVFEAKIKNEVSTFSI